MLHDVINKLKKDKGLTNAQLATLSGTTLSTISKITAGINKNPKLDTLQAICKVLGCTLDDLDENSQKKYELFLTAHEQTHIQKYRKLDDYGKDMVDTVLDKELTRMESQPAPQYIESKVAARGGGVMKHIMTKEELERADAETTEFEGFDELQKFDLDD